MTALTDKSIFVSDADSYYEADPGICLEGEIQSTAEDQPGLRYADYVFLSTKSKNKAVQKFAELLIAFKKCRPENWYITENDFGEKEKLRPAGFEDDTRERKTSRQYLFTDKENFYTKSVGLFTSKETSELYAVHILFVFHFPEGRKFMQILEGLKDGSLRGALDGSNTWKTTIGLNNQLNAYCQSEDYGKNRGTASATFMFSDGEKEKREDALKIYNELKQHLKSFKPDNWYSEATEPADDTTWRFLIQRSEDGYFIDINLTGSNMVFIQFIVTWDK